MRETASTRFTRPAAAVVALSLCALSAGGVAPARGAQPDSAAAAPEPVVPVKPTTFRGDVRRIPQTGPLKLEERPKPGKPDTPPPGGPIADPALQTSPASAPAPPPSSSFAGLDLATWGAGWPPDTNGDVGPTYYVQTVNTSIGMFDKSTGTRVAAFTFNTFFSQSPTSTPCDNSNQGDPVVVYDTIGGRWIIGDFAWANGKYSTGPFYECMAVSRTSDPVSGGWNFYAWQVETGAKLPDYPKLGVWPDGIYMSANVFSTQGSGSFNNVQVWAFNRQEMEAGITAHAVTFSLAKSVAGVTVFSLLPSNARVAAGLPPNGTPNYFASIWGSYAIRAWKFHVDWANTANSTLTGPTNVPIATFNVGPSTVPELSGNNIDTLSYRLMMQNQYTNLSGTESLWLTHTVGNGGSPNVAQVRWYQLPVTGGTISSSPAQQSTWSPDSKNRFMPSLAVDKNGDMAIGYSVSNGSMHPAIRYAGRLVSDPTSTLGQSETSLIEGAGSQSGNCGGSACTRWGDYSAMTIDPDGCTFWYTNEDYGATGLNWITRIGSFKFGTCSALVLSAPSVGGFNPTSGSVGTSVMITGSNFTGATTVAFNGMAASSFTVNSNTQITATVPSGASTGPISVTTGGGTGTSAANFTVTAAGATLTASPPSVAAGATVTVSWSGVTSPTTTDWIGLYHPGDANTAYIDWIYDSSCTTTAGATAKTSGSCSFTMQLPSGTYEFRLLSNDGYTLLATSGTVTVG